MDPRSVCSIEMVWALVGVTVLMLMSLPETITQLRDLEAAIAACKEAFRSEMALLNSQVRKSERPSAFAGLHFPGGRSRLSGAESSTKHRVSGSWICKNAIQYPAGSHFFQFACYSPFAATISPTCVKVSRNGIRKKYQQCLVGCSPLPLPTVTQDCLASASSAETKAFCLKLDVTCKLSCGHLMSSCSFFSTVFGFSLSVFVIIRHTLGEVELRRRRTTL